MVTEYIEPENDNFIYDDVDIDMNMNINIKVIGVGGAGISAVNQMVQSNLKFIEFIEFIAIDSDLNELKGSIATTKIHLNISALKGAHSYRQDCGCYMISGDNCIAIKNSVKDAQMVFIIAGLGEDIGKNVAPIVAEICKMNTELIVAVVSKPYESDDIKQNYLTVTSINALIDHCDNVIVLPINRLPGFNDERKLTVKEFLEQSNAFIFSTVKAITEMSTKKGFICLDFMDVISVLSKSGNSRLGIGIAHGPDRIETAIAQAFNHPLLEDAFNTGFKTALLHIVTGKMSTMAEVSLVFDAFQDKSNTDEPELIWGYQIDDTLGDDEISVTIIVTGVE